MDKKLYLITLFILISGLGLGACSVFTAPVAETETATQSIELTATFTPQATISPSPTLTPTSTPFPTATPSPTLLPTATLYVLEETPLPETLAPINIVSAPDVSALVEWYVEDLTDLAWTADGNSLAAATVDRIELYDLKTRHKWRSLYPGYTGVRNITFSTNGYWLVSSSRTGTEETGYYTYLERWWGLDMKPLGLFGTQPRGLSDMEFTTNSLVLFTAFSSPAEDENSIEFWDTYSWEITRTMRAGTVLDISVSQFGEWLATSPDRYAVQIWDTRATGKPLHTINTSFTGAVTQAEFSPDGGTLATGHYDGVINLWDVATGTLIRTMQADAVIESLSFSPDGSLLATGSSYEDNLIRIWWVDSGSLLSILPGHKSGVQFLLFSPYGDMLVSGSYDGMIRVWGIRP
jgi:WD40 repeat protein